MPREFAKIRFDIWADEDYTDLTSSEQWLYERLLSHSGLSYCGVVEWRPGKLAASASDLTEADIEMFAVGLEFKSFLLIDRGTEEALIRSWVKHDDLMDKWNLASAVARTFTEVASKPLRGVIAHELHRLKDAKPDLRGWTRPDVQKVLRRVTITPTDARQMVQPNPEVSPSDWAKDYPNDWGSESPNESPSKRGNPRGKDCPSESPCPTTSTPTSTSTLTTFGGRSVLPSSSNSPGAGGSPDATATDHNTGRATA